MKNYGFDESVDNDHWVRDHPIYCPVPWCSANKLRTALCGDQDGPYEWIHAARVAYLPRAQRERARLVEKYGKSAWLVVTRQDSIDMGFMPKGRKGRRRL